jgi:hypothetical protein
LVIVVEWLRPVVVAGCVWGVSVLGPQSSVLVAVRLVAHVTLAVEPLTRSDGVTAITSGS